VCPEKKSKLLLFIHSFLIVTFDNVEGGICLSMHKNIHVSDSIIGGNFTAMNIYGC